MNLPHQEPLVFAKKVLKANKEEVEVLCLFKETPTLAMFIEASAQSSVAFNEENAPSIGFISIVKNIELKEKIIELEYRIQVKKEAEIGAYKQFYFEAYALKSQVKSVTGFFTLVMQSF